MLKNSTTSYGIIAKTFHWVIGVGIITLIAVGLYMTNMQGSPLKFELYDIHKATGVVIFVLAAARFLWRLVNPLPEMPPGTPSIVKVAGRTVHYTMYIMMFGSPISGLTMSLFSGHAVSIYGLYTIQPLYATHPYAHLALDVHNFLGFFWIAILTLHLGAVFMHHFVLKDNLLRRMLPW